jgi:hypothetical protein
MGLELAVPGNCRGVLKTFLAEVKLGASIMGTDYPRLTTHERSPDLS